MHRTAEQALRAELRRLHLLFSCVTRRVAQIAPPFGELHTIALAPIPVPLRGGLELTANQRLRVFRDANGWHCAVASYMYALDADGTEQIAFHWDRFGRGPHLEPHIHVPPAGGRLAKAHIPTGSPVPLSAVLAFAIRDLGVEPLRDDWRQTLTTTDR